MNSTTTKQKIIFCLVVFCLDRLLKMTTKHYAMFQIHTLFGFLGIEYFQNTGVAFGLPVPNIFQILFYLGFIFGIFWWCVKNKTEWQTHLFPLTLLSLGATSNTVDRIIYGYTVDYIRLLTSVINIADIMIITGIFLLIKKPQIKTSSL